MNPKIYRQILSAAIAGEIEAHRFYLNVAEKVENDYLKQMFLAFAEEEKKHRLILEDFRSDDANALHFTKVPDFHIAETVQEPPLSVAMKPAEAIALAMKKEETAMKHYTQLAEASTDPDRKKIFFELAAMEQEHKAKMESAFVDIGYPEVW